MMIDGQPRRQSNVGGDPQALGLPAVHPPVHTVLFVPILMRSQVSGWLYAADRLDGCDFDVGDERLAASIAAQLGALHENIRLSNELQSTSVELVRRNDELESFTYSISHDLKGPWREIQIIGQFLTEDCAAGLDERGRDLLASLADTTSHARRLIDDILTLANLSLEQPSAQEANVGEIVRHVIERLQMQIQERGATVEIAAAEFPFVAGSPQRIEQIVSNLIGNGLKFNEDQHPLVEVGIREVKTSEVVLYVRDNGIGIPAEYHEQVFGLFERLQTRERYEGTGAGLAIVKRAAEVSGGRVWLESEPGAGSTFLVALPLANEEARQP